MMQPLLKLLEPSNLVKVLDEAFQLLDEPGVKVQHAEARDLLAAAGAQPLSTGSDVVRIPEALVRSCLATVPDAFSLYNHAGAACVQYGGDAVQFDPGSSGVHVLDADTGEHRLSMTADLVRILKISHHLPAYDAVSTAVVCSDVPKAMGDLYRLYLALLYSDKPVVTGSFSASTTQVMIDMLALYAGGRDALRQKPLAVFDVCPTPPLVWSDFACQNLLDLARAGVPAELVSMPLAGAGSPVTILGSVVQHAAETLSGIVIHQLAQPGAPVVWGGAPAIFDMRQGTTPMGAIETAMIDAAYAQVGKSLDLPTHAYLGASDAKIVDYQAGLESGNSALIAALAGINMISGAGMLDFLACVSPEKLVLDAEAIQMAKRLARGVQALSDPFATAMFAGIDFKPDFLKKRETRQLFRQEQHLPGAVIDRASLRAWQDGGMPDSWARAKSETGKILSSYQRPCVDPLREQELIQLVSGIARDAGMDNLPQLELKK